MKHKLLSAIFGIFLTAFNLAWIYFLGWGVLSLSRFVINLM